MLKEFGLTSFWPFLCGPWSLLYGGGLFQSFSYAFFQFYGFSMSSFITPDSPLPLILAVLLLVIGLGVAAYVLLLVCSAAIDSCGGLFERAVFHRYSKRCDQGDELLEKGDFAGAIQLFGRAFFLRSIRRDSALLSDVATYHTGLLSRLLTIADEMGKGRARLPSLADVDQLLAERLEMHLTTSARSNRAMANACVKSSVASAITKDRSVWR
jgi:hypothetical protein